MSFLMKLVYPAIATLVVGGGISLVATSPTTSNFSNDISLSLEPRAEVTKQVPEQSDTATDSRSLGASTINEAGQIQEIMQAEEASAQDFSAGNCVVIAMPENIAKQLPKEIVYVSFSCKNDLEKTNLVDWKAYFPSNLLKEGSTSLKVGDRINIEVVDAETLNSYRESLTEVEDEGDSDFDSLWTLFTSDQFKTKTLTGNWGISTSLDDVEEDVEIDVKGDVIYKINLPDSSSSEKFYLQY